MAVREIVTLPDPVLRRKAKKITKFDAELQTLIDDMIETMRDAPGVGLAAPQIGLSMRLFVAEFGDEEDETVEPSTYIFVNPKITRFSDEIVMGVEGCLSIPEIVGEVERPTQITITGQNRRGQPIKVKASGWLARIFQHEFDHLNGIMFVDKAERVWQHVIEEEGEGEVPSETPFAPDEKTF
jgi:peptide deformylase